MNSLTTMRYNGVGNDCEYVLKMINIAGNWKPLRYLYLRLFWCIFIRNSLHDSYTQLSYNALCEKMGCEWVNLNLCKWGSENEKGKGWTGGAWVCQFCLKLYEIQNP